MEWYHYLIILAVLVIIALVVIKLNSKDFSSEVNKLVKFLGGKDNIINAEVNMSRLKVIVKDTSKVDKSGIQKLGAQGIVEVDNQIKIIFGKDAKALKNYIKDIVK
jgi:glucose-like phosphotransferase system IIB component